MVILKVKKTIIVIIKTEYNQTYKIITIEMQSKTLIQINTDLIQIWSGIGVKDPGTDTVFMWK